MLRRLSSLVLDTHKGSARWSWKWSTCCQYSVSGEGNGGPGGGDSGPTRDKKGKRIGNVRKGPKVHDQDNREALEFLENLDDIMKLKKQRIEREIEEARLLEERVPEKMEPYHWKVMLTEHQSRPRRSKFLKYLAGIEYRKMNIKKQKDIEKQIEHEGPKEHRVLDNLTYPDRTRMKSAQKYSCYNSLVLGNPIVMDLDYSSSYKEETQVVSQALMCYGENLKHPYPFHMYYTGYKDVRFKRHVEADYLDDNMYATFHEGCFTDLFDKDRLVYLSPDGPPLPPYDANKVYVIGGMVDLSTKQKLSYGKARKLGIQCGRLPLDHYVRLETSRLLTLNAVVKIMLQANLTNDWEQAILGGLPRTQYRPMTKLEQEEKRQKKQFRYNAYRNAKHGNLGP